MVGQDSPWRAEEPLAVYGPPRPLAFVPRPLVPLLSQAGPPHAHQRQVFPRAEVGVGPSCTLPYLPGMLLHSGQPGSRRRSALQHRVTARPRHQCGPRVVISSSQTHPAQERHGHLGRPVHPFSQGPWFEEQLVLLLSKRRKDVRPMWWRTRGFFRNAEMPVLCSLCHQDPVAAPSA